jgi:thiamine biosynthesis lipoprotein
VVPAYPRTRSTASDSRSQPKVIEHVGIGDVPRGQGHLHRLEHVMGMPVIVDVCDPDVEEKTVDRVYAWLRFVDATFSTYREDSEISRLNRGELALERTHFAVRSVLRRGERLRAQTAGYFDMRATRVNAGVPHRANGQASLGAGVRLPVDPSGLVKGWSVAGAARILDVAGARSYCVNAGGDVQLRGHSWDDEQWRVGIQHPRIRDRLAAVLRASDVGIATSGTYERGQHIVNPHTGSPPEGVRSVTIVGPDVATADAFATAAYAMGPKGARWCAELTGYAAMVILADDTVLSTPAMSRYRVQTS